MVTKLDPSVSEFETQEEADAYDAWFRAKVQAALDDPRPAIPHETVMAEVSKIIEEAKARRGFAEDRPAYDPPAKLDPLVSEFETQEQADAYDKWFREKVQARLDKPSPLIPHDQVMAKMDRVIERAIARRKADGK